MELDPEMTVAEFESSYFYASDLKRFAQRLGITVGNARKHEVEALVIEFLRAGVILEHRRPAPRKRGEPRDQLEVGNPVVNYVGDKKTKEFLLGIARSVAPSLRDKSGQWYWLNDWRREQQVAGVDFTYRDLATRLRKLMQHDGRLPQIPSAPRAKLGGRCSAIRTGRDSRASLHSGARGRFGKGNPSD